MKKNLFVTIGFLVFGFKLNAQAPDWQWAKSAIGTSIDQSNSITVDANGNSFITGIFFSPIIIFGNDTLTNAGVVDIYIVKYDASGNILWAKSAGGTDWDQGIDITVDATGNLYLTGDFKSASIIFGNDTLTNSGSADIIFVKYDLSGNVLWARNSGGTNYDSGSSISADANGNSYLTGYFHSANIIFGSDTLVNAATGNKDMFVVKFDGNGNPLWAKSTGGMHHDYGNSITVDAIGNSYIIGNFLSPTITFGSTTLANFNAGTTDIFIVKYDESGNVLWAKRTGEINYDEGKSIIVDENGFLYATGNFTSPEIIFGSDTLLNLGGGDLFVVKYDTSGNELWAKRAGGYNSESGNGISTDPSGNCFITGVFNSDTIDFGSSILTNNNSYDDLFVVKYDNSGSPVWAVSAAGNLSDQGNGIASDLSGNVYITGFFTSATVSFGSTTLTNTATGYPDILVVKLESSTGILEKNNSTKILNIYPNPSESILNVQISEIINFPTSFTITNFLGKNLSETKTNQSKTNLDVSQLPSGIYFVKLQDEKGYVVKKFVKK